LDHWLGPKSIDSQKKGTSFSSRLIKEETGRIGQGAGREREHVTRGHAIPAAKKEGRKKFEHIVSPLRGKNQEKKRRFWIERERLAEVEGQ